MAKPQEIYKGMIKISRAIQKLVVKKSNKNSIYTQELILEKWPTFFSVRVYSRKFEEYKFL